MRNDSCEVSRPKGISFLAAIDICPMRLFRVIQDLLNMLIQLILPQNMTWDISRPANSFQTFFCAAIAFEWLCHFPFSARIKEGDGGSFGDSCCCADFPFSDVDNSSRCTGMIHVEKVRIELLLVSISKQFVPQYDCPLKSVRKSML